jgi:hypothetical protein
LIGGFSGSRALRAASRKSAARRPAWQAGGKWVRFERIDVERFSHS